MSIKDSHTVLEAMTIALVAMENSPWPEKMDEVRKYLSKNYPPKSIALYLARATIRLDPARNKQDVFIQYGIAEPERSVAQQIPHKAPPMAPKARVTPASDRDHGDRGRRRGADFVACSGFGVAARRRVAASALSVRARRGDQAAAGGMTAKSFQFIWHAGERCLAPRVRFACELLRSFSLSSGGADRQPDRASRSEAPAASIHTRTNLSTSIPTPTAGAGL